MFDPTQLLPVLLTIVLTMVILFVVAFIVFHATDIIKLFSRWTATVPAFSWTKISGYGSYVVALILSTVAVFYPQSGLSDSITKILTALNVPIPTVLIQVLTTFLISIMAAAQHDSGKMPTPLSSTPAK